MNFDEFACLAESTAKSWLDNYYDMCANEEFGLTNNGNSINNASTIIANPLSNRSDPDNSTISKTAKNHLNNTSVMQTGTDNSVTTPTAVPVSRFFSSFDFIEGGFLHVFRVTFRRRLRVKWIKRSHHHVLRYLLNRSTVLCSRMSYRRQNVLEKTRINCNFYVRMSWRLFGSISLRGHFSSQSMQKLSIFPIIIE